MVNTREIRLDAEAEQILAGISRLYGGDVNLALSELLKTTDSLDAMVSEIEAANAVELTRIRDQAERQLVAADTVSWNEVKRRKGL